MFCNYYFERKGGGKRVGKYFWLKLRWRLMGVSRLLFAPKSSLSLDATPPPPPSPSFSISRLSFSNLELFKLFAADTLFSDSFIEQVTTSPFDLTESDFWNSVEFSKLLLVPKSSLEVENAELKKFEMLPNNFDRVLTGVFDLFSTLFSIFVVSSMSTSTSTDESVLGKKPLSQLEPLSDVPLLSHTKQTCQKK